VDEPIDPDPFWNSLPDRLDDWCPDGRLTWADAVGGVKGREAGAQIIEEVRYQVIHEYLEKLKACRTSSQPAN